MKAPKRQPIEVDALRERAAEIYELAQAGLTTAEIAEHFGVSEITVYRWRQKHPKLDEAMRMGANLPDDRVVASLYKQATGYTYKEQQAIKLSDARGNERVEIVEVERRAPPVPSASIFWLKNRRRTEWRDTQQIEADVNVKTDAPDPTQLALALLATMQAAVAQQQAAAQKVIEHDDDE